MINPAQLREHIVRPVLYGMGLHSKAAENLILGTAAAETGCGRVLVQAGGPALGVYGCEPDTHKDLWENWLRHRPTESDWISRVVGRSYWDAAASRPRHGALISDLGYATAICRYHYRRVPEPLPDAEDWTALGRYWKKHYNTPKGRGSVDHWLDSVRDCGIAAYKHLSGTVGE